MYITPKQVNVVNLDRLYNQLNENINKFILYTGCEENLSRPQKSFSVYVSVYNAKTSKCC